MLDGKERKESDSKSGRISKLPNDCKTLQGWKEWDNALTQIPNAPNCVIIGLQLEITIPAIDEEQLLKISLATQLFQLLPAPEQLRSGRNIC